MNAAPNSVFLARMILAAYGINAAWTPDSLRVAVVARLPKPHDRKQFNFLADRCATHEELIELAATTLEAFKKRRTSLLPPAPHPSGEMSAVKPPEETADDLEDELKGPYTIK